MKRHLMLLCLLGLAKTLAAQDFFLAPDGLDDRDGKTPASAWKSLERASRDEFQPGDRLLLKSGAEFPGTLTVKIANGGDAAKPFTITSTDKDRAIIQAGESDGIFASDSGLTVRNLIIKGTAREKLKRIGVRLFNARPKDDKRSGIVLEDLDISGFGRACIFVEGGPDDKSASGFKDVRIENCVLHDGTQYGILSLGFEQAKGSWKYAHANLTVKKCEVFGMPGDPDKHDNHSGNGILLGNVDGAVIEYCCAHHNGEKNGSHVGGPVGIWTYCARKVIIQYCEAYENHSGERAMDGGGFDLDGGVVESILQYNYSHDNDGAGYLVYSYKNAPHEMRDNIVRFNISINDGRRGNYGGICVGQHDSENVNTLVHNNLVIVSPTEKGKPCALVTAQTKDLKVYNNIFMARKGADLVGTWDLKPGENVSIRGGYWVGLPVTFKPELKEKEISDIEVIEISGSLRLLSASGSLEPKDATEATRICWPKPPATLRSILKSLPASGRTLLDLKEAGVKEIPEKDFEGKPITSTKFNGPFVPEK